MICQWIFCSSQVVLLVLLVVCLSSTHWTSWHRNIQWTSQFSFVSNSTVNGELKFVGHAGLWSRCSLLEMKNSDTNWTKVTISDDCLSYFGKEMQEQGYSYGKACKMATVGLCIFAVVLTSILIISTFISNICRRPRIRANKLCKVIFISIQGIVLAITPLIYLSGNMSEMIDSVTNTYTYLKVVGMTNHYQHDWATWSQVSTVIVWIFSIGAYAYTDPDSGRKEFKKVDTISHDSDCETNCSNSRTPRKS